MRWRLKDEVLACTATGRQAFPRDNRLSAQESPAREITVILLCLEQGCARQAWLHATALLAGPRCQSVLVWQLAAIACTRNAAAPGHKEWLPWTRRQATVRGSLLGETRNALAAGDRRLHD